MHQTVSERALILAPNGRDADIAAAMLREGGMESATCTSAADMADAIARGAGFAVIAEESLHGIDLHPLVATLDAQEQWSDLPFILLTRHGGGLERNPEATRYLQVLRNVTFLERPFHPTTFVSLARAALRGRRRQYDARARLIELAERETELRDALAAGDLGQWTLYAEGPRLDASAACRAIYGRDPDAPFTWQDFLEGVHPDDRPMVDAQIERSAHHGANYNIVFRFVRPDGTTRWIQAQGRAPFGSDSPRQRATGVIRDITEQREAENRLRESERQFRTLADSIPALCWVADAAGSIYWYNSRWYEYTGTSEADMVGYGWQAVHDPDVLPQVRERYQRSITTGEPFEMVFPLRSAQGSFSPFLTRMVPVTSTEGAVTGWFGTNTDISAQLEAERSLRDLADQLETRVEERTRQHAEATAQLHEAQKIETLGQLTGGVAHDFNNLLTPVIGALELLARDHQDPRSQRLIKGAQEASDRSRTLISRLLAFARRQTLETKSVDVGALVTGMVELIERSIGPRIAVELAISPGVSPALVDPNQLELALLNLAVNARDAMSEGGTLTLAVDEVGDEQRFVRLAVRDTGAGMDAPTLARAIEPFYSTKEVGKGTGLGLSMVHGLAAQSGGTLHLTSTPGEGTVVELSLPVAERAVATDAAREAEALVDLPALRVLLVDDNDLVRRSTAEMLDALNLTVVEADSGTNGLAALEEGDFDLVLSDYLMPGMTGADFLSLVLDQSPGLPVLLISGFTDVTEAPSAFPLLAKPFTPADLQRALMTAIAAAEHASPQLTPAPSQDRHLPDAVV
jgi:PAS domain S-box-containing protein